MHQRQSKMVHNKVRRVSCRPASASCNGSASSSLADSGVVCIVTDERRGDLRTAIRIRRLVNGLHAFQARQVQVMWQQQPNEAAQIVSTANLDNRKSLLCRSFAEEGFCSTGLHVAEFVRRQSSVHARFRGGMFYP